MIDVLVVGAGPAGLAAALHAAQAGLEVVVLDPRVAGIRAREQDRRAGETMGAGPIDKACGEGLMPGAVRGLQHVGLRVTGHPIVGIRYCSPTQQAQARFHSGPGAGVRRTELHDLLTARARELEVRLVAQAAGSVEQDADSVTVAGLRARYLIASDGLHSPIRRQLNLDRPPARSALKRWGLRQHFDTAPWTDHVEVHWSAEAELYVTPVSAAQVGVAVLTSRPAAFRSLLADFPAVAERLSGVPASAVRGAGPLRQRSSRRRDGRVVLLGDAAGYVDALTGDGIAVGLACASALVRCLVAGRPQDYEREWRAQSRRYRLITEALLWTRGQPTLARHIVPAARRAPWLFSLAVNQLAR